MSGGRRIGPLGCLGLILFFVLETAAGIAVAAPFYLLISPLITAIVPAKEYDFAQVVSICLCFLPGGYAMYLVDKLCKRVTGFSVFDELGHLPTFY
ncbi:hypothetical protein [Sphingomonas jatrophae]|uniref:Uncharacterized protein n=1 Tax=Sphingomonas jatrophae TaxID=1166337 RepID=A0A1I6JJL9_9SPHN|nr:hypothetical protein [Sphingomonas jatrophae]SFR79226.1 hypothetical protein SAMN05192580_0368 [Sphingomonas jatrophae]